LHLVEGRKCSEGSSDEAGIAGVGDGRGNTADGAFAAADNAVAAAAVDTVAAVVEGTYSQSGSFA
jgi:hypothetical protein